MRRPCPCGRPIYRGQRGRMAGAGLAQYWVVTLDRTWRHTDGTEACADPGPSRIRTQTGHTQVGDQLAWLAFLAVFVIVGLRLLRLAL